MARKNWIVLVLSIPTLIAVMAIAIGNVAGMMGFSKIEAVAIGFFLFSVFSIVPATLGLIGWTIVTWASTGDVPQWLLTPTLFNVLMWAVLFQMTT